MEKPKKKRFLIDVTEEDHQEVKVRAANRGITMRKWILRAIAEKIEREERQNK